MKEKSRSAFLKNYLDLTFFRILIIVYCKNLVFPNDFNDLKKFHMF
jgi:hypothetical protein